MTERRVADMSRALRLVWLYRFFHSGNRARTAELAARLHVSQRTIERDILDLDSAGLVATIRDDGFAWRALPPPRRRAG